MLLKVIAFTTIVIQGREKKDLGFWVTSAIIVSMHIWRPFKAAPSALAIAVAISSQQAAWAPSTGSSNRATVLTKCCHGTQPIVKLISNILIGVCLPFFKKSIETLTQDSM
jgi:hypothetical protein